MWQYVTSHSFGPAKISWSHVVKQSSYLKHVVSVVVTVLLSDVVLPVLPVVELVSEVVLMVLVSDVVVMHSGVSNGASKQYSIEPGLMKSVR